MRDIFISVAGKSFETGMEYYKCHVGCQTFIFDKEGLIHFLLAYIREPERIEKDYYARTGAPTLAEVGQDEPTRVQTRVPYETPLSDHIMNARIR